MMLLVSPNLRKFVWMHCWALILTITVMQPISPRLDSSYTIMWCDLNDRCYRLAL